MDTNCTGCAPGSAVLLSRLAKQIYRRSDERALGMHLRHLMALSYVLDHDNCPQQDLADAFCMDANNVVLLLNELEQAGYATRVRDPHDRRRHLVQITPAGHKALTRAESAQAAVEDEVLAALDINERQTLCELLTRALHSLEPADGPPPVTQADQDADADAGVAVSVSA
jgi:DNA-binding MarR family transcriptional regulator